MQVLVLVVVVQVLVSVLVQNTVENGEQVFETETRQANHRRMRYNNNIFFHSYEWANEGRGNRWPGAAPVPGAGWFWRLSKAHESGRGLTTVRRK